MATSTWRRESSPVWPARGSLAPGSGLAFGSLIAFTFVLLLAPQNYVPIPSLGKLSAGLAILTHVAVQIASGAPPWRRSRPLMIAAALFAWAVVTTPFSLYKTGSVEVLLDQFLKSLAVFWLLASVVDRPRRLHALLWALSLMSVPITLTAISNSDLTGTTRITGYRSGLAENPNSLAMFLNILWPLSAGLLAGTRSVLSRMVLSAVIVLDVLAIILSFSRAGFLALMWTLGLFLVWFIPKRKRVLAIAATAIVALAGVSAFPAYQARLTTIWNVEADATGSAQERQHLNTSALQIVARQPLVGSGIGMDVLALNEFGNHWRNVHNIYLEYAVDLGLPGLFLFVWLFAECVRSLIVTRRVLAPLPAGARVTRASEGIFIALIGFAISGFFAPGAYYFYFYYAAGLALAAEHAAANLVAGKVTDEPPLPVTVLDWRDSHRRTPRPPAWRGSHGDSH